MTILDIAQSGKLRDGVSTQQVGTSQATTRVEYGTAQGDSSNGFVLVRMDNAPSDGSGDFMVACDSPILQGDRVSYVSTKGQGKAVSLANLTTIAEQADSIASATNQHFWDDTNGAHVTEVTQDEWNDSTDPNYHSGKNSLWNSLGILFRDGLNNLLSIVAGSTPSDRGIAVYDGQGNNASNIVASFTGGGATIGKAGEAHIVQSSTRTTWYAPDGSTELAYVGLKSVSEPYPSFNLNGGVQSVSGHSIQTTGLDPHTDDILMLSCDGGENEATIYIDAYSDDRRAEISLHADSASSSGSGKLIVTSDNSTVVDGVSVGPTKFHIDNLALTSTYSGASKFYGDLESNGAFVSTSPQQGTCARNTTNTSGGNIYAYRNGGVCTIRFSGLQVNNLSARSVIGYVPVGYRPPTEFTTWFSNLGYIVVNTDGSIECEQAVGGRNLWFNVTYVIGG